MKIGIFGGAFNPVHNGHLNLAQIYYDELKLDKLIFIPTAKPPHKTDENFASAVDRVNMLNLAIENKPYEISTIEFDRSEKSYTYDTLIQLRKTYPNDEFYLIIGADQFFYFDKWYRYEDILSMVTLCTCARENENEKNQLKAFAKKLSIEDNFYLSTAPVLKVSSSEIRQGIKFGKDVTSLLPKKVLDYIVEKELYCV
jgi:nicotinate-nucleotide adenylyltransferase